MDKETVVCGHKEEWNYIICRKMGETRDHHVNQITQTDKVKYLMFSLICRIYTLKKWMAGVVFCQRNGSNWLGEMWLQDPQAKTWDRSSGPGLVPEASRKMGSWFIPISRNYFFKCKHLVYNKVARENQIGCRNWIVTWWNSAKLLQTNRSKGLEVGKGLG
jgi:hypothetical protein